MLYSRIMPGKLVAAVLVLALPAGAAVIRQVRVAP
jgi:hypothetical protein